MLFVSCKRNEPFEIAQIPLSENSSIFLEKLSGFTPFEWDRLYAIGPYQDFDCRQIKKLPHRVEDKIESQKLFDNEVVILFIKNETFVNYSVMSFSDFEKTRLDCDYWYESAAIHRQQ